MRYANILLSFAGELWAMDRTKLAEIVAFLLFKADGGQLSTEEIQARVSNTRSREVATPPGAVGVLPVSGLLVPRVSRLNASETGTPLDALSAGFRSMMANDSVKAIILDVDSPGGILDGTQEFADEVFAARGTKPVVAQVNTLAASAAYWIAAQADEVVASPSAHGGSIGVYTVHDDVSKALEMKGVTRTVIKSSSAKAAGAGGMPLNEEALASIQRRVIEGGNRFTAAVARGRGVTQTLVNDKFGQGDVFSASDMLKRGMVDRIAPMAETLSRFGVELSPARRSEAQSARAALALGKIPAIGAFEALLREAGAPKSLATALASGGYAKVGRSESDPKTERSESDPDGALLTNRLAALHTALRGFTLPNLGKKD